MKKVLALLIFMCSNVCLAQSQQEIIKGQREEIKFITQNVINLSVEIENLQKNLENSKLQVFELQAQIDKLTQYALDTQKERDCALQIVESQEKKVKKIQLENKNLLDFVNTLALVCAVAAAIIAFGIVQGLLPTLGNPLAQITIPIGIGGTVGVLVFMIIEMLARN